MDILLTLFYINFFILVGLFLVSLFWSNKTLKSVQTILGITFIGLAILNGYWSLFTLIAYFMIVPLVADRLAKKFEWAKRYKFTVLNVLYLLGPCVLAFATGHYIWGVVLAVLICGVLYAWKEGIDAYF